MTTAQPVAESPKLGHPTHPLRRALVASALTLGLVLVMALNPDAVRVFAASPFGELRSPGESAFIAAHRGDRSDAPENTLPAFQSAFNSGFAYVETDLQLTRDGQVVLMHDTTVDRTTNGTGSVANKTLDELRKLDAGSWYDEQFRGTLVPTLAEFLDLLADSDSRALLELKGDWTPEEVRSMIAEIFPRGVQNRVSFASFSKISLASLSEVAAAFPRIVLRKTLPKDPVALVQKYTASAIMTRTEELEQRPEVVEEMHDAGLGVLLYTLNDRESWAEALALGVDGIATDRPSALDGWIAQTAPGT